MIIKNVRIITKKGITEAEVKIEEERIVKISKDIQTNEKVLDGESKLLFAGRVDNHVHIYKKYLKGSKHLIRVCPTIFVFRIIFYRAMRW
ncbi:hypothetical protein EWF20_07245 [Sulfolobus sp. S-194]|uniref:hypothetical protein n=1 Tax=Sulfolobus sp. S-194 TaxID=2512240 RepID=UPI001436CD12|nr:hypothetical protein [Sulfolobus sp. S-194]QIW23965.1 hypothetical protein EWF20_07245 [Sulfolobus sp. S-194]